MRSNEGREAPHMGVTERQASAEEVGVRSGTLGEGERDPVRGRLWMLVDRLTTAHDETVTASATKTPVAREALLDEIRASMRHGAERVGGATGFDPGRAPLNMTALSLYDEILGWVSARYGALLAQGRVAGGMLPDRASRAKTWLRRVAQVATTSEAVELVDKCEAWVDAIESFYSPSRVVPIRAACPHCGRDAVEGFDELGEAIRRPALLARFAGEVVDRIECAVCGSSWCRVELELLVAQAGEAEVARKN